VIILDTGGLYAYLDTDDADHDIARAYVDTESGPFILSPFVLAELDCLVQTRLGVSAECALLDDVDTGVYTLVPSSEEDMSQATALVKTYADLGIGITDASVAVIASRHRSVDLLCVDERHFRAVRPLRGGDAFRLLPYDQ
jgi:predicted nucleic acid-binding protein